jgi:orotidine-5'-phosphate decarboxylase
LEQVKLQSSRPVSAKERLIVALDVPSLDEAKRLAQKLSGHVGMLKVGLELYARHGVEVFDVMESFGLPIFFDCKFLDIPNTVSRASRQLVGRNIEMFNVHATGGAVMMRATADAVIDEALKANVVPPKILGVTILTSLGDNALRDELGWDVAAENTVSKLAKLSQTCGLDGVVASALEAQRIREICGEDFIIVTPGVRPDWASVDDQVRAVTPAQAFKYGADYIVVGRPITRDNDPAAAALRIIEEVEAESKI